MMKSQRTRLILPLAVAAIAIAIAVPTQADVTIVQTTTSSGMGGLLDSETQTELMIKGDRQYVNTRMQLKNKLMGMFGGSNKPVETTAITCLDKSVVWDVMHDSKSYTETPIMKMSDMMDAYPGMSDDEGEEGFDTEGVKMSPPKINVEKTGKKETIAGYACEQSILTMEMEGERIETGEKIKFFVTMDMMLAENVPGFEEQQAFNVRYAKAVGLDEMSESMSMQSMLSALTQYGIDDEALAEQMKGLKGVPLRTVMTMRGEGPLFGAPSDEGEGESEGEESGDAKAQEAMKQLGGLFGGGKGEESSEAGADDALMTSTTEVTKISTGSIPDSRFEPPAGYKKTGSGSKGPE